MSNSELNDEPNDSNTFTRRKFLQVGAVSIATARLSLQTRSSPPPEIKAVLFDALVLFNGAGIVSMADKFFPGQGQELCSAWRTKQFEYTWLRTAGGKYRDFWNVTGDALNFATRKMNIAMSASQRDQLMNGFLQLDVWPDVVPALRQLRSKGIHCSLLTNFTTDMLTSCLAHNNMQDQFDHLLSTDRVKAFKPASAAYQMGLSAYPYKKNEMLFAAFGNWDAAGAKWFGYPTYWVNRAHAPAEELGAEPDGTGDTLTGLLYFIESRK